MTTIEAVRRQLKKFPAGSQVRPADIRKALPEAPASAVFKAMNTLADEGKLEHNGLRAKASAYTIPAPQMPRQRRKPAPQPEPKPEPVVDTTPEAPETAAEETQGELVPMGGPISYSTIELPSDARWHKMVTIPEGFVVEVESGRRDGTTEVWIRAAQI